VNRDLVTRVGGAMFYSLEKQMFGFALGVQCFPAYPEVPMRQRNMRIVIVGVVLLILALGFFVFMRSIASTSNGPVSLMQTVGTVTGVVSSISVVMIIAGLIRKRRE